MRGVVRGSSVRFGTTSMHHKLTITLEVTCDLKKIEISKWLCFLCGSARGTAASCAIPNVSIFPSFRAWSLLAYNFVKRKRQRSSWIRPRTRRGDARRHAGQGCRLYDPGRSDPERDGVPDRLRRVETLQVEAATIAHEGECCAPTQEFSGGMNWFFWPVAVHCCGGKRWCRVAYQAEVACRLSQWFLRFSLRGKSTRGVPRGSSRPCARSGRSRGDPWSRRSSRRSRCGLPSCPSATMGSIASTTPGSSLMSNWRKDLLTKFGTCGSSCMVLPDAVADEFLDDVQALALDEPLHQAGDFQPSLAAAHGSDGHVEGL